LPSECRVFRWHTLLELTFRKTSAPNNMSTGPGILNSGSANFNPATCFHLLAGGTGMLGRLPDTFINTKALLLNACSW
jgi:hypothetical protein